MDGTSKVFGRRTAPLWAGRLLRDRVLAVAVCSAVPFAPSCRDDGAGAAGGAGEGRHAAAAGKAGRARAANGGGGPAAGRGASDPGAAQDPDSGATDPEAFAIALSTSSCDSGCPAYDLTLDASGAVEFNGRGNTRQQGWSGKTVSPPLAAELLQAFRGASYWELAAAYRTVEDGCAAVAADRATYTWNVRTEGQAKIVADNLGCSGVPALDALRRIPALLREKLALDSWIGF